MLSLCTVTLLDDIDGYKISNRFAIGAVLLLHSGVVKGGQLVGRHKKRVRDCSLTLFLYLVARGGLEPPTPAL